MRRELAQAQNHDQDSLRAVIETNVSLQTRNTEPQGTHFFRSDWSRINRLIWI